MTSRTIAIITAACIWGSFLIVGPFLVPAPLAHAQEDDPAESPDGAEEPAVEGDPVSPEGVAGSGTSERSFRPFPLWAGAGGGVLDPEGGEEEVLLTFGLGGRLSLPNLVVSLEFALRLQEDGSVREQDWDEASDFPNVIDHVTWGGRSDWIHARVGRLADARLGHGTILRHYRSDTDFDSRKVGLLARFETRSWEAELVTNNVAGFEVSGGRILLRPFELLGSNAPVISRLGVGGSYVVDITAPSRIERDPVTGEPRIDSRGNLEVREDPVHVGGVELELPLVETFALGVVPYVDANWITGGGAGVHAGARITFGLPLLFRPSLSATAEVRHGEPGYIPTYFDAFYEIQRFSHPGTESLRPKRKALRDAPAFDGYYLEGRASADEIGRAGLFYADDDRNERAMVGAFAELTTFEWLRARARYRKRDLDHLEDATTFDDRSLLVAEVLVRTVSIVYARFRFMRTWRLDEDEGSYVPVDSWEPGIVLAISW